MKGSVYALPLVEINVATVTSSYERVSSHKAPFVIKVHATNHSDIPIRLSLDGIDDHDVVLPYQSLTIDIPVENKGFLKGYFIRSDKVGVSQAEPVAKTGKGMFYISTYCISQGV